MFGAGESAIIVFSMKFVLARKLSLLSMSGEEQLQPTVEVLIFYGKTIRAKI